MSKERLDILLVSRGLAPSREKAKAFIMAGLVYVDGQKEDKAGATFDEEADILVKIKEMPFVSRGGYKLDKAIKYFNLDLKDKVCMDIGASTGGFTDCMLQNGAAHIFSVDVGHGQLDWKLRNDKRVTVMEKFNVRYIKPEDIEDKKLDFASVDVSFISLTKILNPVRALLKDEARMACLIKPQFEAGREQVGKHGVVRDTKVHEEVIKRVATFMSLIGFNLLGLTYSPIKGPEGNIEYLIHISNDSSKGLLSEEEVKELDLTTNIDFAFDIKAIVKEAHLGLENKA